MDSYDEILVLYQEALENHYAEDEDALLDTIEEIEDNEDVNENVLLSLKQTRDAMELEDPVITEAKLILG